MYQNSDIRKNARSLYLKNFKLFVPFLLIIVIAGCMTVAAAFMLIAHPIILFFVTIAINIIAYPIVSVGLARVTLSLWRQEPVCAKDIFLCLKNKKLLRASLSLGAIITVIDMLLNSVSNIPAAPIVLISVAAQVYFTLHIVLAEYLLILDYASGASDCISMSINCMKGRSWDYFKYQFALYFIPLLIVLGLVTVSVYIMLDSNLQYTLASLWPTLLGGIFIQVLSPYFSIAVSGYFNSYLEDKSNF